MQTQTIARADVHEWCEVNEQGLFLRPLPKPKPKEKPSDIPCYICEGSQRKREPWYLREPKEQWRWLIAMLRFVRERWVAFTVPPLGVGVFWLAYAWTAKLFS